MGEAMRPGRRITYKVRVVSPTALLYNSHLPQVANPTAENPKASSTSQMGKGGPWPGFASRTLPRRKEARERERDEPEKENENERKERRARSEEGGESREKIETRRGQRAERRGGEGRAESGEERRREQRERGKSEL